MSKRSKFYAHVAECFHAMFVQRAPELRLGKITFEGRGDYSDFDYGGNGAFPVGMTPALNSLEEMTVYRTKQKLKLATEMMGEDTFAYLARVTFHELGHGISMAMNGTPERILLANYGFKNVGFFTQPMRVRKQGFRNEIEAFAIQCALFDLCGLEDEKANFPSVMQIIRRKEWKGILNEREREQTFLEMHKRCTIGALNRSLDRLNTYL